MNKNRKFDLLNAADIGRPIISIDHKKSLLDAKNLTLRYNISRVVVTKNKKVIGIITEKDISNFIYTSVVNRRRLSKILIKEISLKKLITVVKNTSLNECAKTMLKNNISSLLLTNAQNTITDIITKTDLTKVFRNYYTNRFKVRELMSSKVHSVHPEESIFAVTLLMDKYNIKKVIVVKDKKPIGLVTAKDFLPLGMLIRKKTLEKIKDSNTTHITPILLVQNIMSINPITVNSNSDSSESTKLMLKNRISGLPVVDNNENLVGIITKTDIVKALLK
ncbi:MAG: CBS domain-containing protein [Nitrososphaeraceae archaeon]